MACKKRVLAILRNKKAISHEVFLNVFEIVLAAIVIITLLNFVQSVVNNTIFEKNYLSRDLATLTNTIYSAPGDVNYNYQEKTGKFSFTFDFSPSKIKVSENYEKPNSLVVIGENLLSHKNEQDELNNPVFYLFGENKNFIFDYTAIKSDKGIAKLNFIKSNSQIKVSKGGDSSISSNPLNQK